jgi:hypothetical protein
MTLTKSEKDYIFWQSLLGRNRAAPAGIWRESAAPLVRSYIVPEKDLPLLRQGDL